MFNSRSQDRKGNKDNRGLRPKKRKPPQRPEQMESETEYTSSTAKKLSGQLHEVHSTQRFYTVFYSSQRSLQLFQSVWSVVHAVVMLNF